MNSKFEFFEKNKNTLIFSDFDKNKKGMNPIFRKHSSFSFSFIYI